MAENELDRSEEVLALHHVEGSKYWVIIESDFKKGLRTVTVSPRFGVISCTTKWRGNKEYFAIERYNPETKETKVLNKKTREEIIMSLEEAAL